MQKHISFQNVAIAFVKRNNYGIHFWYMSKGEAINLLRNSDLTEKVAHYKTWKFFVIYKNKWRSCKVWQHWT